MSIRSIVIFVLSCFFSCNQYVFNTDERSCPMIGRAPTYSLGTEKVTIDQGVWGDVRYWAGDFMPPVSSAANPCPQSSGTIQNVKREIVIFPLVNPITNPASVQTDAVGAPFYVQINIAPLISITSDETGFYQSTLASGNYSIFTKEVYFSKTYFYANTSDGAGNLQPIEVKSSQKTHFPLNITYASTQ